MKTSMLKFVAILLLILIILVVFYVLRNLNYDYSGEKFVKNGSLRLGLEEKQFHLKDGSVINYAEGPDNGPDIVLFAWANGRLERLLHCLA